MNVFLVVVGLIVFVALLAHLARLIARDGLRSNPTPRSHLEELGSWSSQQLRR